MPHSVQSVRIWCVYTVRKRMSIENTRINHLSYQKKKTGRKRERAKGENERYCALQHDETRNGIEPAKESFLFNFYSALSRSRPRPVSRFHLQTNEKRITENSERTQRVCVCHGLSEAASISIASPFTSV